MDTNTEKSNAIDLFKERKETLFISFKAIYEKIISKYQNINSLQPGQINSYIESTVNNILTSEREQFIFYIIKIISEISNSLNIKNPEFVSKLQEDIQKFNKKYDKDGQLTKILYKYFSKEYNSANNEKKLKEIPKIQSFYPHLLGFSYEALLMRSMLFDIRTIVIAFQNSFSSFLKKVKQKINYFYQVQKREKPPKEITENEFVLKEREKANILKKNLQIMQEENDKFKLKVEGEIMQVINLINSFNSNKGNSSSNQITLDELNKQSKNLIKLLKSDSSLNEDHLKNDVNVNETDKVFENAEKANLIKQLKEKNETILNLRSQLNDLKVDLLRTSLNKSNFLMKEENSSKDVKNIEYFMSQSESSRKENDNDVDLTFSDVSNKNDVDSVSSKSHQISKRIEFENESFNANDSISTFSYINHNREDIKFNRPNSFNNHKYEIEELKRQLNQSKSLIDQLTDQNRKKDKTIANLNLRIQDSSSKFDALFDKINILKQKNKTLKRARNANSMIADDSPSSASVYCCTRENLLVEQISDKTNELIFKDSIIIELENENRKLQAQIEMMKENNNISSRQVLRLKDDIQHIQDSSLNDLDELSRQLNEKQILIREQADKISEFQQMKDKSEKYQKLKIINKKISDKYQALLDDVNKNQIEVQRVFEINKLKNENLKSKYTNLKEKYDKKKKINEALLQQNKKLMQEIENLQKLKNESEKNSVYQSEASSSNNPSLTDSFNNGAENENISS